MRSPQGGRHTGPEGLREQRGIEETRCIRAKVTLSCHACQGRGRRRGWGMPRRAASQIVRQGSRLPVSLPLSVCGPLLTRKKKRREGKEKKGTEALFLWSPLP